MNIRYSVGTFVLLVCATVGLLAQEGPSPIGPTDKNADDVHFISKPSPTARVNTPYVYTAVAVSSDSTATIRYSGYFGRSETLMPMAPLIPFPIDSMTGVTNWTPTARGWYEIVILARSSKGGHEHQEFNVLVSGGNGTVQGRVTDTLNVGIPNVMIQALNASIMPMQDMSEHDGGSFYYSAKTDSNGYYKISPVELGQYKLHAISTSPNYAGQWYDGKNEAALANVVTVTDSPDVLIANFTLRGGIPRLPKILVSGQVTDTLGMALNAPGAKIFFVRSGFALNTNSSVDDFRDGFDGDMSMDFRMEGNSSNVFSTKADSLGNYQMRVPAGSYIAFAQAVGYARVFFQNQSDFTSANVLVLQSDTANINFALSPLPTVGVGGISGMVLDSTKGIGVRARVMAFRDRWTRSDQYRVAPVYSTDTDSLGAYAFNQLLPGSYIVFSIPVGSYAPAYYTTDTATARWKRATRIVINGNTVSKVNIYVRPFGVRMRGYTAVNGTVRVGGQGVITGAFVYAISGGEISGYGITDNSGNYLISGLAPGTYAVTVDKTGFDEVGSQSATVSYNNSTTPGRQTSTPVIQTINFTVSGTTSVVAPFSNIAMDYRLEQNYPNPFNPSTMISFALPQPGLTTLKVYNILGQEVTTLLNGFEKSGVHQVLFDAATLSSGVYFYKLQSGNFVQSKKMVLLK
jgi:hypothetical protein